MIMSFVFGDCAGMSLTRQRTLTGGAPGGAIIGAIAGNGFFINAGLSVGEVGGNTWSGTVETVSSGASA